MTDHIEDSVQGDQPDAGSDIDRLAQYVSGPEDQIGMAALWRAVMTLPQWWFIAVGPAGEESPAAAQVGDDVLLLAFTSGDRAREFAVSREMIGEQDALDAIALTPQDVVDSADSYRQAEIHGLIFDAHITAFSIPADQLDPVWSAVMASPASATDTTGVEDSTSDDPTGH